MDRQAVEVEEELGMGGIGSSSLNFPVLQNLQF